MKSKKKTISVYVRPSDQAAELNALELLTGRSTRCFALYWWQTQISPALVERKSSEIEISNSCLQAVLVTVRDLDDFFSSNPKRFQTDFRANDFPEFASKGSFLSASERNVINQFVIHLTYFAVEAVRAPEWNTVDLVSLAVHRALAFIEFIEERLKNVYPEKIENSRKARGVLTQGLANMKRLGDREKLKASESNMAASFMDIHSKKAPPPEL